MPGVNLFKSDVLPRTEISFLLIAMLCYAGGQTCWFKSNRQGTCHGDGRSCNGAGSQQAIGVATSLATPICQCSNSFRKEKARPPVATAAPSFVHHMKFGLCVRTPLNPLPHCGLPGRARPYNWPASVGTEFWAIKQSNELADTLCLDGESQQSSRFTHPARCPHTGVVPNHRTTAASVTLPHRKGCSRRRAPCAIHLIASTARVLAAMLASSLKSPWVRGLHASQTVRLRLPVAMLKHAMIC